jgi:hypothetical protein
MTLHQHGTRFGSRIETNRCRYTEEFMGAIRLGPSLAAAITLGLALLPGAAVGLAMAIQQGGIAPPSVDWQFGRVRITAYRTSTPECPPYFCLSKSVESAQASYVVWCINELTSDDQSYRRYRNIARRILVVPLKS